ncbi:MAG: DNA gyrase subunit A, partial [Chloroflexi bacterium]|nr:DNA gyrase subunit A [Chloroflexota bacterium]
IYEALVRLAQDFSMRYQLVDGQGNFGSIDGDPPAAMRYTEARLTRLATELLADIDRNTVDFSPNFDGSLQEPVVLPARAPNLLINGSAGIAVGMATNIPPHNLTEVCNGVIAVLQDPDATTEDLLKIVKGPDFPTRGQIVGREGVRQAYATGHGRVVIRGRAQWEEDDKGRQRILITELPYQVNKAALVEKIADLIRERRLDGIAELRDESDRKGMRVLLELKPGAQPQKILNALYKYTAMQSAFYINMLALVDGRPQTLGLKQLIQYFIEFRRQVIRRRAEFDLGKARDRAHILEGLLKALDNLDAVIQTIRRAADADAAKAALIAGFTLTAIQAQAILELQLRRLAALERQKITDEAKEVRETIASLEALLADPRKVDAAIVADCQELQGRYAEKRRTAISAQEAEEFSIEDLVPHEATAVILSQRGYVKRVPVDTWRRQRRTSRGKLGITTVEQDAAEHLLVCDTHDSLLFFTNRGKAFHVKCWDLPADVSRTAKGLPVQNLIQMDAGQRVTALVAVRDFERQGELLILCTRKGEVKKTSLEHFARVRANGIIAMDLESEDELVSARMANPEDEVMVVTRNGRGFRFPEGELRLASRTSGGVRGIRLEPGDEVVAMEIAKADAYLLCVSNKGRGKLTPVKSYPVHHRGTGGVIAMRIADKAGAVAAARVVYKGDEIMLISRSGVMKRTSTEELRALGRVTQGVQVINLDEGDEVATVASAEGAVEDEAEAPTPPTKKPPRGETKPGRPANGRGQG